MLLAATPHAHSQKPPVSPPNSSQKSSVSSSPRKAPKKSAATKAAEFARLRSEYVKEFLERFPVVATYLGVEGLDPSYAALDGRLRDYSPAALHAERDQWTGFQARLSKIDLRPLPEPDRIDASVMESQLAFLVHNLDRRVHERALDVFLEEPLRGAEWALQGMTPGTSGARGTRAEWQALAARAAAVPSYLKTALANVRRGTSGNAIPDRRLVTAAVDAAESTAAYFETALPEKAASWGAGLDAETRASLSAACPAAAAAFREFRKGLVDLYFEPDGKALKPAFDRDRFAVGEAEYTWALRNNLRVTRAPRELHAYGKARVAETLAEMTALARRIAADHELKDASPGAVMSYLGNDMPKNDAEMLSWYQQACRRLVEYGRKTAMFDLPADYRLDVVFTPPPLRDTIDAAYYPAPQFKKEGVGQFYVTPTGDDPAVLREHARAAVASLAAHEGFPGHDWYYQYMRSRGASISAIRWLTPGGVEDSASMWEDAMSSEGWALYCERLVGEPRAGLPDGFYTPEERFFELQNQLLRDARVVIDTGLHCGFMSFEDAVTYYARNVVFVKGPVSTDPALNPDAAERAAVASARREV
ncbi:MAG TPA: DUF885 domain-containing protein, partial [Thermoanaerobaculia bacterium]|nr:DUF885 domain-containing protein [Thermoanaerobaculia bacterium]